MKFFNGRWRAANGRRLQHQVCGARQKFLVVLLLGLVVGLSACSSTPTPSPRAKDKQDDAAAVDRGEKPVIVLEGPDENPYLTEAKQPPRAAQQLFDQALNAMSTKKWQEAELLLQQLTAEYPNLSGAYVNLGIVYRNTNRADKAAEAFQAAISANSLNVEAYNQLAFLQREQGDFKAAEENYLSALKVWPKHAQSHKNLGILYDLYLGQLDKALDHFQKYEYLVGDDDKLIAGWIIDLQRRVDAPM